MIRKAAIVTLSMLMAVWAVGEYAEYITGYGEQLLGLLFLSISLYKGWLLVGAKKARYESFLLFLFIFSFLAGTIATNTNKVKSVQVCARLTVYFLIVVGIAGMKIDTDEAYKVVKTFLVSLSVVCAVSLLSYFRVYDPSISSDLIYQKSNLTGIKGPFASRTVISRYITLSLPVLFLFGRKKISDRYLTLIMCIVLYSTSVLTHSRGTYICLGFVVCAYLYIEIRHKKRIQNTTISYVIFAVTTSILLLVFARANALQNVIRRIWQLDPLSVVESDADMLRVVALRKTIEDLITAPFGLGSTGIMSESAGIQRNPHNTFTSMVRSAGVVGALTFVGVILSAFFRYKQSEKSEINLFLVFSVFSAFLYGMTHGNLNNLGLWVFYGSLISISLK